MASSESSFDKTLDALKRVQSALAPHGIKIVSVSTTTAIDIPRDSPIDYGLTTGHWEGFSLNIQVPDDAD